MTTNNNSEVYNLESSTINPNFIGKLRSALRNDGDFPASANIVNKLLELTKDSRVTAQQVAELILHEPSLSIRILHLVNSTFYRRAKPIMTVTQAVVAVGMKSIAELCAGLVLLQRFIPMARNDGSFANCFKDCLVTSILSSSFSAEIGGKSEGATNELGYIAGFFSEIGILLLAYYFPKIYEAALKRSKDKNIPFSVCIHQITGLTPENLSIEILTELGLPKFYIEVLTKSQNLQNPVNQTGLSLQEEKTIIAAKSVFAAFNLSTAISSNDKKQVDQAIEKINQVTNIKTELISEVLCQLPKVFAEHYITTEISLPELPNFLTTYSQNYVNTKGKNYTLAIESNKLFNFLNEIRQAVQNKEPTASIITLAMESLMFGLGFDRVVLLLYNKSKSKLVGRMSLGIDNFSPESLSFSLENSELPAALLSIKNGRTIYNGQPLIERGWPFVYIPIGKNKQSLGLIYADCLNESIEIGEKEKAFIELIVDLIEKSIITK